MAARGGRVQGGQTGKRVTEKQRGRRSAQVAQTPDVCAGALPWYSVTPALPPAPKMRTCTVSACRRPRHKRILAERECRARQAYVGQSRSAHGGLPGHHAPCACAWLASTAAAGRSLPSLCLRNPCTLRMHNQKLPKSRAPLANSFGEKGRKRAGAARTLAGMLPLHGRESWLPCFLHSAHCDCACGLYAPSARLYMLTPRCPRCHAELP